MRGSVTAISSGTCLLSRGPRVTSSQYCGTRPLEDGTSKVRVIAGEFHTTRAVIETNKPILYLHIKFQAGINIVQPVISDHNFITYIIEGHGLFREEKETQSASEKQLVLFARNGDEVCLSSGKDSPTDLLLFVRQTIQ